MTFVRFSSIFPLISEGWIGASGLLSIPIYVLYVFQSNCGDSYASPTLSNCVNLLDYGILSGQDFPVCGTVLITKT